MFGVEYYTSSVHTLVVRIGSVWLQISIGH